MKPFMLTLGRYKFIKSLLIFLFATTAISIVCYIDLFILDVSLLTEGFPNFKSVYQLRTALIILSSMLYVISVLQLRASIENRFFQNNLSGVWENWGILKWSPKDSAKRDIVSLGVNKLIVWAVLLLSLFFLFIFLTYPNFFSKLSLEDRPVETASAVLYFINCFIFILIFIAIRHRLSRNKALYLILSLSFAFVFFLIGIEEVSWFQRFFHFETTGLFKSNLQGEVNLHNFSTGLVENMYYFSSFVFLILIPFIHDNSIFLKNNGLFSFFIPSRFVLFVSGIFVAYNYDMWNILFTQLIFFVTLFIFIYYTRSYISINDKDYILSLSIIIVVVLTQTLFIVFGDRFVRTWDVTEYKEMFMPLSYFMYSCEVFQKAKSI